MTTLTELLNNPEDRYPGNFDTPERANALLTGLCQDAAIEIERLQDEVLEQCRINGMGAYREDALRAEVERLKAFAELVRADEREACWRLCDALWIEGKDAHDCREAIRARGNT